MDSIELKKFFYWRQKDLLWMLNTPEGRKIVGVDPNRTEKIIKVVPNGYHFKIGRKRYIAHFFQWDKVAEKLLPILDELDILNEIGKLKNVYKAFLHVSGFKRYSYPLILHTVTTFSANSGGRGRAYASNATYLTARNAASGSADTSGDIGVDLTGGNYFFYRSFHPFDTSSIGAGKTVQQTSNTFLRLVGDGSTKFNTDSDKVNIVASTQASNTALAGSDYSQIGSTLLSSTQTTFTAWATSGNNDFPLNAAGVAQVSISGYSKFASRAYNDINSITPAGRNDVVSTQASNLLSVEYVAAGGGFFLAAQ